MDVVVSVRRTENRADVNLCALDLIKLVLARQPWDNQSTQESKRAFLDQPTKDLTHSLTHLFFSIPSTLDSIPISAP